MSNSMYLFAEYSAEDLYGEDYIYLHASKLQESVGKSI